MADLSHGLSGPTLGPHVLPAGSAFLACLTELVSTELAYATELSRLVSSPPTDSSSSAASSILAPLLPSVSTRAHALGPAAQALFTAASSSSALPLSPAPPAPAAAAAAAAAGGDVSAAHDAALAALAVLTTPQTPTEAQAWSAYLSAATATVSSSSSAASAASAGSVSVPCRAALLRLSRAESLCLSLPALRPQTAATLGATGRGDLVAAWATAAAVAAAAAPSDEAAEAGAEVARAYDAAAAAARAAAAAITSALGNENGVEGRNIAAAVADAAPMLRLNPPGADCPPDANEAAAEAAAEVAWLLSAAALSFSLAASASVAGASAGPVAAAAAPADLPATAAVGMGIALSSSLSLLRPGHAGGVRGIYTLYAPLDRAVAGEPGAVLAWDHPVSAHTAANSNSNSNSSYVGSGWLSLRGSLAAARVRGSSRTLRLTLLPSEDAEGSVGEKQPAVLLLRADTDAEADRWVSALSAVADAVAAATAAAAAVGGVRSSTPLPPSLAAEASVLAAAALARQGLTPSATPRPRARSRTPAPAPDGSAAGAEAGAQRRGVSGWSTPQRPLAHSHAHSHAGAGTAARAALARARAREISNSPVPMPPSTPILAPAGGEQVTVGSVTVGNGVSRTRSRQHSNAGSISEPMDATTHSHVQHFQQQQQQLFEQGRRSRAASLTGLSSTAAAAATAASASASASASPAAPVRAQIPAPGASRVPATPPHAPRASPAPSVGHLTPSRRLTPSLPRRHRSPALAVAAAVQTTADIALKRIAAVRKIEEDAARAVKEEMARLAAKIEALEKAAREPLPAGL